MFIIGDILIVKARCVLANMLLNKLLFVIGILLQSLVIINMLKTLWCNGNVSLLKHSLNLSSV